MAFNFRVPDEVRDGLKALASLDGEFFDRVFESLSTHPPILRLPNLIEGVSKKFAEWDGETNSEQNEILTSVIFSLVSLSTAGYSFGSSITDLVNAATSQSLPEGDEAERLKLGSRLKALIELESIEASAKSAVVLQGYPNIFRQVQIFTDVRPVFIDNAKEKPSTAVIAHNIKFTYVDEEEFREFFITLDSNDLELLKTAVEKAIQNNQGARAMLEAAGTIHLNGTN